MTTQPTHPNHFGKALQRIRKAKGISQETFALTSSRTYVSTLERGLKSPTLSKIDELAEVLEVHPLTLLMAAYSDQDEGVIARARKELEALNRIKLG
jgi:transcriptional regulator with XRE-family HTH domain